MTGMCEEVIYGLVDAYIPPNSIEDQWDVEGLSQTLANDFLIEANIAAWVEADHSILPEQIKDQIYELASKRYQEKEALVGREVLSQFEKSVILQTIDNHWREHLAAMDYLRQGIHLRGYAQKDPKQEYKRESFALFTGMLDALKYEIIRILLSVDVQGEADVSLIEERRRNEQVSMQFLHEEELPTDDNQAGAAIPFRRNSQKVGRNDTCPCGSNKKYKSCHGRLA